MKLATIFAAVAAVGLVVMPVAAQAGSRASDPGAANTPSPNNQNTRRKPPMGGGTDGILIAIGAAGAAGLGLAIALSNQKSNGTN